MIIGSTNLSVKPEHWLGIADGLFAISLTFLGISLPEFLKWVFSQDYSTKFLLIITMSHIIEFLVCFFIIYDCWHLSRQTMIHSKKFSPNHHILYGAIFAISSLLPPFFSLWRDLILRAKEASLGLVSIKDVSWTGIHISGMIMTLLIGIVYFSLLLISKSHCQYKLRYQKKIEGGLDSELKFDSEIMKGCRARLSVVCIVLAVDIVMFNVDNPMMIHIVRFMCSLCILTLLLGSSSGLFKRGIIST
jgi:hypothetical protein